MRCCVGLSLHSLSLALFASLSRRGLGTTNEGLWKHRINPNIFGWLLETKNSWAVIRHDSPLQSPEPFVSRAKASPAKGSEKGYGDKNVCHVWNVISMCTACYLRGE